MIQRQQTLWLLLATICAVLTYFFPFLTGYKIYNPNTAAQDLDAASNFYLLVLTGILIILTIVTIFQFKDRKLQLKLVIVGMLLSALIIAVYIIEMQKLERTTLALYSILPVLVLAGYIMAFRGIRHDNKLVKSLDKLR